MNPNRTLKLSIFLSLLLTVTACGPVPVPDPPFEDTEIVSFTETPTSTPTETITPSVTATLSPVEIVENQLPIGFTLYDTFDADLGKWKFTDDSPQCHRVLEEGRWKIECFGSATQEVDLTLFPSDEGVKTAHGIAMAFYTLPQLDGTIQWGKYQIEMRFGNACEGFEHVYYVSIRPNELTFVEADSQFKSINPPSPTAAIGTLQPHIVRIELENGKVVFYLDNKVIREVVPVDNTAPACWMIQSEDNNSRKAEGYRGLTILWVATKP